MWFLLAIQTLPVTHIKTWLRARNRWNYLLPQLEYSLQLLFHLHWQSERGICDAASPAGRASVHLSGPPGCAARCGSPWAASSAGRSHSASGSPLPGSPSAAASAKRSPLTSGKPERGIGAGKIYFLMTLQNSVEIHLSPLFRAQLHLSTAINCPSAVL